MPNPELCDHAYGLLLRDSMPYVVAPPGAGDTAVTVRGVTRLSERHARIAVTTDPDMASGVAVTVDLHDLAARSLQGNPVRFDAMIVTAAALLRRSQDAPADAVDSHGNSIMSLPVDGSEAAAGLTGARLEIYSLLNQFTAGGGAARFTDVYRLTGFMFQPQRHCRLYIDVPEPRVRYGLQIPLIKADGHAIYGVGASLIQELFARTREGLMSHEPHLAVADDYCDEVLDLSTWIDPPLPRFVPPAPPGTYLPGS